MFLVFFKLNLLKIFISFTSFQGAGHMVPTDRPIQALEMFVNYIQNTPF